MFRYPFIRWPVILLLSGLVNLLLFTMIPALHNFFGGFVVPETREKGNKRLVAEMIRPKEEKPKEIRKELREMVQAKARSVRSDMMMKFTPDLDVAGGQGVAMESRELEAMVVDEGQTDQQLVKLYTPPPEVPLRAIELGISGTVMAILVIGRDGRVESVEIEKSPHPSLSSSVRKALSRWRFKPATYKGVPVKVRRKQPIEITLE